MQRLSQWPVPIIRKWLLLPVIGFICPVIGLVMMILNRDTILMYMSMLLAFLSVGRCILLYRQIGHGEYTVIEGVCLSTRWIPLQRQSNLCLMTDGGEEFIIIIKNKTMPHIGHRYRAYIIGALPPQSSSVLRKFNQPSAFAIEYLGRNTQVISENN